MQCWVEYVDTLQFEYVYIFLNMFELFSNLIITTYYYDIL